jgi:hypothetical protein
MKLFYEFKELTIDIFKGHISNHTETVLGFASGFGFGFTIEGIENFIIRIVVALILGFVSGFGGWSFKKIVRTIENRKHRECECNDCLMEKIHNLEGKYYYNDAKDEISD